MSSLSRRRNSMEFLLLYDLKSLAVRPVSTQTERVATAAHVEEDRKTKSQDQSTPPKSILEQLPNELLIYIFQFLSPYDLYCAVYNLNFRLNTICHVQKLYLDLSWTKYEFNHHCSVQQPFGSQIYSVKLCDEYDRLTLVNQLIDISLFTNLRALKMRKASPDNFDKILSKLHLLPHLSYLNIYSTLIRAPHITKNIFQIRSLERLILYSVDPIILHFNDDAIIPLTKLEYLELDGCYMIDFLELLKYVGSNVKQMKIALLYKRDQDPASIGQGIIDNLIGGDGGRFQIPASLRRLQISFNYLSLTDFHLMLRLFPHLKHLILTTATDDLNFISASVWDEFISVNLLKLEQFQFYIKVPGSVVGQRPPSELVHSFDCKNNRWMFGPVIMDYNYLVDRPFLELYTYSQPKLNGKYSTEFHGKERHMNRTATHANIDVDKKITELKIILTDNHQPSETHQLSIGERAPIYPKVRRIIVHSELTTTATENDQISRLICSDLMKSIPDSSQITTLEFTSNLPTNPIYPSKALTRRLLNKMRKIDWLYLPFHFLLYLLESPLIVQLLTRQIKWLWIKFYTNPSSFQEVIRIINICSTNLRFLNFDFYTDFPVDNFYHILPVVLGEKCKKLIHFNLRLSKLDQQPPQTFNDEFKLWLKEYLAALAPSSETRSAAVEYRILESEISISF